jgi:uncharacterized protein YkvS
MNFLIIKLPRVDFKIIRSNIVYFRCGISIQNKINKFSIILSLTLFMINIFSDLAVPTAVLVFSLVCSF